MWRGIVRWCGVTGRCANAPCSEEVPGQAGWYRAHLQLRPHLKYMGASFTLSLVGKLERESQ